MAHVTGDIPPRLDAITTLISTLGSADMGQSLLGVLYAVVPFDSALVVLYRPRRAPAIVGERFLHPLRRNTPAAYLNGAYLLDPFYARALDADRPQLLRLADIAPPDFARSEYFSSYYKHSNVVDEVNFIVPAGGGETYAVSIERSRAAEPFADDEIARLSQWLGLIAAALGRHHELCASTAHETPAIVSDAEHERLEQVLASFGSDRLTPREQDVVQLMLKGASGPTIAERLDVSVETVRVHRRNIYEKLNVSSLAELFARAMARIVTQTANSGGTTA